MPLFSVIVPTRNRAPLLKHALASVLGQTFGDFELVVSDNFSKDDTRQVVGDIKDERISYVRTEAPLSMPDSWEFALKHARGEYVAYLSDDDAWCPTILENVAEVIRSRRPEVLNVAMAWYYYPDWLEPSIQNTVRFAPVSGKVQQFKSGYGLDQLFRLGDMNCPRMIDTFCSLETIKRIQRQIPRIFLDPCPDYSFSTVVLANVPGWTRIDRHLCVIGQTKRSIGASTIYTRGDAHRNFMSEFGDRRVLRHTPLTTEVVTNLITNTILEVKDLLKGTLSKYDIDWRRYFYFCWEDMKRLEAAGVDITPELDEWRRVLAQHYASIKDGVDADVDLLAIGARPEGGAVKRAAGRILKTATGRSPLMRRLWGPFHRMLDARSQSVISGSGAGFSDITGCARYIGSPGRYGPRAKL